MIHSNGMKELKVTLTYANEIIKTNIFAIENEWIESMMMITMTIVNNITKKEKDQQQMKTT